MIGNEAPIETAGGVEPVRIALPGAGDRRDERAVVGDDLVVLCVRVDPLDRVPALDGRGRGAKRAALDLDCHRRCRCRCGRRGADRKGGNGDEWEGELLHDHLPLLVGTVLKTVRGSKSCAGAYTPFTFDEP